MKRIFNLSAILLSFALVFTACNGDDNEPTKNPNPNPVTGAVISGAIIEVNQSLKEITATFEVAQDVSNVSVNLTLAEGVTMVSPATNPFSIDLSDGTWKQITVKTADKEVNYKIKAIVNVEMGEPFTTFTARAEDKYDAVVSINHISRSVALAFDAPADVDLSAVAVDFTLADNVTVTAPSGKSWALSTSTPTEFKLEKFGEVVTYSISVEVSVDLSAAITAFTAKAGAEDGEVVVDNVARTISLVFLTATDFSAVTVGYTLADKVTAAKPAGSWDLSAATKESPLDFVVTKYGEDVTYKVYLTKYFTPPFRTVSGEDATPASVPEDWVRITAGISPDIAFYKIDVPNLVAYAIAAKVTDVSLKTISDGYESGKTVAEFAAGSPNTNFVINGGTNPELLVVDGQIIHNTNGGNDNNSCIIVYEDGELDRLGITNRVDENGDMCGHGYEGEQFFGDDLFFWDQGTKLTKKVISAGSIGAGVLNWGARGLVDLFPEGIYHDINKETLRAVTRYGASDGIIYFFVCEKSARSNGITDHASLQILRNMGCNDGALGTFAPDDESAVGLIVNGTPYVEAASGEYSSVGYAFGLSSK